jgi:hypothetical protein
MELFYFGQRQGISHFIAYLSRAATPRTVKNIEKAGLYQVRSQKMDMRSHNTLKNKILSNEIYIFIH